jgi:hypothetical protein
LKNNILLALLFVVNAQASENVNLINVFPKDVSANIKKNDAQSVICSGGTAKYNPEFRVEFVMPKPKPGTPLDKASEHTQRFLKMVRAYFTHGWFYNDLSNYRTDMEYSLEDNPHQLSSQTDIAKFYSEQSFNPEVSRMQLGPAEWFPQRHLALFVERGSNRAVLVPKLFFFLKGEKMDALFGNHFDYINQNTAGMLDSNTFFTLSEKDKNGFPIQYSFADDLSYIKREFIILPKDKSISNALAHKQFDWLNFFSRNTVVLESPTDDGRFIFTLKLKMDEFCRDARLQSSVVAK